MNRLKGEDDLERVTEELTLQLVKKFMEVKSELVRHDGDPSSWTWFYDDRPYPLASSIVQKLGTSSLEERDVIYLIAMAIFSEMKVDRDRNEIKLDGGRLNKKVIERLRAPAECQFSVPISTGRGLPLSLEIGGPHKLSIHSDPKKEALGLSLSGSVNAIHEEQASRQIEADVKSVLGVSISMGIAEPLPLRVYEIPLITFANWPAILDDVRAAEQGVGIPLDPVVGGLAGRMKFALPSDLDELENRRLGTANAAAALDPRLRALRNLLSNNSTQGEELRNAARLLFDSFAAVEPGMAIALAFMSMEAVLLDSKTKESIVARLSEAVAYRLGRSAEQRKNLRKQVSKLYDARSSFVHTGKVDKSSTAVGEAREIACSVLRRETLDLDAVEEQKTELTPVSN